MWRLNAWYLTNKPLVKTLKAEITHYFQTNDQSVDSPGVLWASGKATIRGVAKSLIRRQERDKQSQVGELEAKILRAEIQLGLGGSDLLERQLAMDMSSLVHIQKEEAKLYWCASAHRVYESRDKNGKLSY